MNDKSIDSILEQKNLGLEKELVSKTNSSHIVTLAIIQKIPLEKF
jgi:hypothetical protein